VTPAVALFPVTGGVIAPPPEDEAEEEAEEDAPLTAEETAEEAAEVAELRRESMAPVAVDAPSAGAEVAASAAASAGAEVAAASPSAAALLRQP
jgi:hypothetical protein